MPDASIYDPNFPQGLQIQPSSSKRSKRSRNATASSKAATAVAVAAAIESSRSWDEDNQEDIEEYGIAGRIWEAAYLMAAYLRPACSSDLEFDPPCSAFAARRTSSSSSRIIAVELGSGAGFGGLHFAEQLRRHRLMLQAHPLSSAASQPSDVVILTDLHNVVSLMERNVGIAGLLRASPSSAQRSGGDAPPVDVLVRPLAWGFRQHAEQVLVEMKAARKITDAEERGIPTSGHPLTHVFCSDLVYFPELLPPLLRSLIDLTDLSADQTATTSRLASGQGTSPEVVISYKIRSLIKEQPFWSAFGSWFDYQAVDCRRKARGAKRGEGESREENEDKEVEGGGDWHRFGSRASDLMEPVDGDVTADSVTVAFDKAADGDADPDDELFVFVAKRRPETGLPSA